jgi:hypothetical protein
MLIHSSLNILSINYFLLECDAVYCTFKTEEQVSAAKLLINYQTTRRHTPYNIYISSCSPLWYLQTPCSFYGLIEFCHKKPRFPSSLAVINAIAMCGQKAGHSVSLAQIRCIELLLYDAVKFIAKKTQRNKHKCKTCNNDDKTAIDVRLPYTHTHVRACVPSQAEENWPHHTTDIGT